MRLELPILFAARLSQVARIVVGPDDQQVLAFVGVERVGDVRLERRIPAFVGNDERVRRPKPSRGSLPPRSATASVPGCPNTGDSNLRRYQQPR